MHFGLVPIGCNHNCAGRLSRVACGHGCPVLPLLHSLHLPHQASFLYALGGQKIDPVCSSAIWARNNSMRTQGSSLANQSVNACILQCSHGSGPHH
ncbi:hypothetical protein PVAP13_6NG238924 [Panicum virgatum]|uniref:Uncharacterized protein n=1 Tax=Panicum virgatum TaxID=38727 RepID=A0A8T0R0V7_PANVG|nr:hypothetical protein PVAP13_6NG238924 [Panicum virgatum]